MTRSALATLSTIFIIFVVLPHAVRANGYDVHACNPVVAGGANHSWASAADVGMAAYSECPTGQGIVARNSYDGGASGFLQGAYAIFDAPAGNSIDSVSFEAGLRRNDCSWGVELVGGGGDLGGSILFGLPANQMCDSTFQTPDENTYFGTRFNYAVPGSRVRIESRCGLGSCPRTGVAGIHVRNVDVRVHDDVAPGLSGGRGGLWMNSGWVGGQQAIGFDAADSAGISSAAASLDGRELARHTNACDFSYSAPCPQAKFDESFSTASFGPDGDHTLTLSAVDAAGNGSSASTIVHIDNTAPDHPRDVTVAGGDGWRPTNDFDVSWQLPPNAGAPIVAAEWDLCLADGSSCAHGTTPGTNVTDIDHIKVPAPGDYTLKIWLRDSAGNQDRRLAADPVTLRYDDASPTLAFDPPDPNDPTLVAVPATDLGSGVASGVIQMRHQGGGNWLTLPTTVANGRLEAHIDDEHLGDGVYELQATATDAAGNQRTTTQRADGSTETITLPLRLKTRMRSGVVVRHGRRAHLARAAYARYGQLVRVRGRISSPEGNPLQDVEVQAWTQIRDGVTPPRLIATVKTTKNGSFTFLVRKGPSRSIKIRYGGTTQIRGVTKMLSLNVRSVTSMRPNHRRRVNGESVRFHGRIRTGRIPQHGKIVEVQVFVRGKWRTFATARAGRRGLWAYDYRFDGTRGNQTYRFRAKVPPETGYPFATGRSHVVRVHVRGV
jgi:hypothetical protein